MVPRVMTQQEDETPCITVIYQPDTWPRPTLSGQI
jgi:hypothetical protein